MNRRKAVSEDGADDVLFESHGMPKRMNIYLVVFGLLWVSLGVFHLVCALRAPKRVSFAVDPSPYSVIMDGDMEKERPSESEWAFDGQRKSDIVAFFGASLIGVTSLAMAFEGRKLYMKIYNTHIEGLAGISVVSREVVIPIDKVCFLASYTKEMIPSVAVYTAWGSKISFYMSGKKAVEAEKILRGMINWEKK